MKWLTNQWTQATQSIHLFQLLRDALGLTQPPLRDFLLGSKRDARTKVEGEEVPSISPLSAHPVRLITSNNTKGTKEETIFSSISLSQLIFLKIIVDLNILIYFLTLIITEAYHSWD